MVEYESMTGCGVTSQLGVRGAVPADAPTVRYVLAHAARLVVHAWEWEQYLGQECFLLAHAGDRPVGTLLARADAGPVGWVVLGAVVPDFAVECWLDECLPPLRTALRRQGVRALAWMDAGGWAGLALGTRGFGVLTQLVTMVKEDRGLPPAAVPGVRLRQCQASDVDALVRVDRAAFSPPWWLSGGTIERMRQTAACFLVAESAGRCAGYVEARLTEHGAHIGRLVVDPGLQGEGIGGLLLSEAIARLWAMGATYVMLNTQEDNLSSQRFYYRFGFRPFGERIVVWARSL